MCVCPRACARAARVNVVTGELISFLTSFLRLRCKRRAEGWRGLADPSKLAELGVGKEGACGLGAPLPRIVQPFGEKIAEEGGK